LTDWKLDFGRIKKDNWKFFGRQNWIIKHKNKNCVKKSNSKTKLQFTNQGVIARLRKTGIFRVNFAILIL